MKKGFKIFFLDNNNNWILFSDYLNSNDLLTSNEQLTEEENSKYTLSFDIFKNIESQPYLDATKFFRIGRVLKLELFGPNKSILLVIDSITPTPYNENFIWSITAQDYARVIFSKNNVGLFLNTMDEDFLNWFDNLTEVEFISSQNQNQFILTEFISTISLYIDNTLQKENVDFSFNKETLTITLLNGLSLNAGSKVVVKRAVVAKDIILYILFKGGLKNEYEEILDDWNINNPSLSSEENKPLLQQINLELSNSNTYNALVEIAFLINSNLIINYTNKTIDLIGREDNIYKKNYLLSPYFNLQEFSLNYNSDSFYPILYVNGGTDEIGLTVTMTPYLTYQQYKDIERYFNGDIAFKIKVTPHTPPFQFNIYAVQEYTSPVLYVNGFVWSETDWSYLGNTVSVWGVNTNDEILFVYKTTEGPKIDVSNIENYYDNPNFYDSVLWSIKPPDENTIQILNYLVYLDSFIINLEYFLNNNLIEQSDYNEILDKIYNNLRIINAEYQKLIYTKYRLDGYIKTIENKIENFSDRLVLNETLDYVELNNELENLYLQEGGYIAEEETVSNFETSRSTVFTNVGTEVTMDTLTLNGYIFHPITLENYLTYKNLDEAYTDWNPMTGAISEPRKVFYDNIIDQHYVAASIQKIKPNFNITLNAENTGIFNTNLTENTQTIIYDDPRLDWDVNNDYFRYKWEIDVPQNMKNFNSSLIGRRITKSPFFKSWTTNQNYFDTFIKGSIPADQGFYTKIIFNSNLSNNPTAERYYRSSGQSPYLTPFPNSDDSTARLSGSFSKEESIQSLNTTFVKKIKKYIHHDISNTIYWIVLEQISNNEGYIKVYSENFQTLIKSIDLDIWGDNLIDFDFSHYLVGTNKRWLSVISEDVIFILDISNTNIANWFGVYAESGGGDSFGALKFVKDYYDGFNYYGTALIYNRGTTIFRRISTNWEGSTALNISQIGTVYSIESYNFSPSGITCLFVATLYGSNNLIRYHNTQTQTTQTIQNNSSIVIKKLLVYYHLDELKHYLFFNETSTSTNIVAIDLTEQPADWTQSSARWATFSLFGTHTAGGYIKDFYIENNLLYAYGVFGGSVTKDRLIALNINGSKSNWEQNSFWLFDYTRGTTVGMFGNNKEKYNLANKIYQNNIYVFRSSSPYILNTKFLNYLPDNSLSVPERYANVVYNEYTNLRQYKNAVWKNNNIWNGFWTEKACSTPNIAVFVPLSGECTSPADLVYKYDSTCYYCSYDNLDESLDGTLVLNTANFEYIVPERDQLLILMNYFDLLQTYKGVNFLEEERPNKLKLDLTTGIKEKDNLLIEIQELKNKTPLTVIEEAELSSLLEDLSSYRILVGNQKYDFITGIFTYEELDLDGQPTLPKDGKLSLMYKNYINFLNTFNNSNPVTYANSICGLYEDIKKQKQNFWYNLKKDYGKYLYEGYYLNEIETISFNLYKQGLENSNIYQYPNEEYSLTYLDSSNLIGKDIDLIGVGDYIKISSRKLGVMEEERNEVKVNSISRELRDISNISLSVDNANRNTSLVEKILASISQK